MKLLRDDRLLRCCRWRGWKWLWGFVLGLILAWGLWVGGSLQQAAGLPVDGVLVLGGSIKREMYAAQLMPQLPGVPIVVSGGSPQPCAKLVFERERGDLGQVWLEGCARSTLQNFVYGLPILRQWRVRKVKLITSGTHTGRALVMARVILGSHGIWVEPDFPVEQGRPGNRESHFKTVVDIGRSLGWAVVSQFYQPRCGGVVRLPEVDMALWRQVGFQCERQGHVGR